MNYSNIYCVWYPSGGFGHFVSVLLHMHGKNFIKIKKNRVEFGNNGNSHMAQLAAPKYFCDTDDYDYKFSEKYNYAVLIDNGITNESDKFKQKFIGAKVLKICYSEYSWPIISKTMIEKSMVVDFDSQIKIDPDKWQCTSDWAMREKYFLFLRDHHLQQSWKQDNNCVNLFLDDFLDYFLLYNKLNELTVVSDFECHWQRWKEANNVYLAPVTTAYDILELVKKNQNQDLSHIKDIWTQSVIYYFIWLKYNFEIPHNDYSEWFTNINDIITMLNKHEVKI